MSARRWKKTAGASKITAADEPPLRVRIRDDMGFSFERWRRRRILAKAPIDRDLWHAVIGQYVFLRRLNDDDRERLKELATLFLHDKVLTGAGGQPVTQRMRVDIAAQACMLILNLDLRYYRGFREIIVYPGQFVPQVEYLDEAGVVHVRREIRAGESWQRGPLVLSWEDVETGGQSGSGYNVVLHEFAHKIDMLNGTADGFPPLHADMERARWARVLTVAFDDFRHRVDSGEDTAIDPYAAESPAEFFAVLTEVFFELPDVVRNAYPDVYQQLARFYRQDPALRTAT
jgi:Mlc titration factor MtfA (ptsG expression regulator)